MQRNASASRPNVHRRNRTRPRPASGARYRAHARSAPNAPINTASAPWIRMIAALAAVRHGRPAGDSDRLSRARSPAPRIPDPLHARCVQLWVVRADGRGALGGRRHDVYSANGRIDLLLRTAWGHVSGRFDRSGRRVSRSLGLAPVARYAETRPHRGQRWGLRREHGGCALLARMAAGHHRVSVGRLPACCEGLGFRDGPRLCRTSRFIDRVSRVERPRRRAAPGSARRWRAWVGGRR